jgi:hypothetical protein
MIQRAGLVIIITPTIIHRLDGYVPTFEGRDHQPPKYGGCKRKTMERSIWKVSPSIVRYLTSTCSYAFI